MTPAAAAAALLQQQVALLAGAAVSLCLQQRLLQQCVLLTAQCHQGPLAAPKTLQQLMVQQRQSPCHKFQHPAEG